LCVKSVASRLDATLENHQLTLNQRCDNVTYGREVAQCASMNDVYRWKWIEGRHFTWRSIREPNRCQINRHKPLTTSLWARRTPSVLFSQAFKRNCTWSSRKTGVAEWLWLLLSPHNPDDFVECQNRAVSGPSSPGPPV